MQYIIEFFFHRQYENDIDNRLRFTGCCTDSSCSCFVFKMQKQIHQTVSSLKSNLYIF